MLEDQTTMLGLLAACGVLAMITAFYLAMRKLKKTEQKLLEIELHLEDARYQMMIKEEKNRGYRKSAYRNGFTVGFRSGIAAAHGKKWVFDEENRLDGDEE